MSPLTEAELRRGLDEGEFVPFMQPLVNLRSGDINGFEALARWNHPRHGLVLPQHFIHLAEATGLIWELTAQLCRQACRAALSWPDHILLSMNISPDQFADRALPDRLEALAAESGFPLRRLMIEITETGIINNYETARAVCDDLKRHGIQVALDDFGTGYSSLRAVHELQLDRIKIDASFIQSIGERRQSRKLVASMVGLGRNLGLTIVAEGIEHEEQADMLASLGCDVGQGWLFGKPTRPEKAAALAARPAQKHKGRHGKYPPGARVPRAGDLSDVALSLEALSNQRNNLLQALYSASPVGLCLLDRECRFLTLNQRLADLNKLPVAAHLGRTLAEIAPGRSPETDRYLERALAGEVGVIFETGHADKSRVPMTLLNSFEPVRDESGEVVGVSCVLIDVTAQARTRQDLRESQETYQFMVELNPHMPFTAGPDGDLIEISSRWGILTGTDRKSSFGKGWISFIHADDLGPLLREFREGRHNTTSIRMQFRVLSADGTYRWCRATTVPHLDDTGTLLRWYGLAEDIHDRHAAAAALRDHYSAECILDAAQDAVMVTDADFDPAPDPAVRGPRILYVNEAFTQLTGHTPEQAIGQSPRLLHGPGTSRVVLDQIRADLLTGQGSHQRVLNYTRSGAMVWLDLHIVPLRDSDGRITHFASVARDVTFDMSRLDALTSLAKRDALTGILNRPAWMHAGRNAFDCGIAAAGYSLCIAYIDVDRLKAINDRFGHATGDVVLAAIAARMATEIRASDILGRIGGEEFAVCMPNTTLSEAQAIAERLRISVASAPFNAGDETLAVSISIGVTVSLDDDPDFGTILGRADKALYAAKSAGGDDTRISNQVQGRQA